MGEAAFKIEPDEEFEVQSHWMDAHGRWDFTPVPNSLLRDRAVSSEARLLGVLLYAFEFGSGIIPNQGALAQIMGKSVRSVRGYFGQLVVAGHLKIETMGGVMSYTLVKQESWEGEGEGNVE